MTLQLGAARWFGEINTEGQNISRPWAHGIPTQEKCKGGSFSFQSWKAGACWLRDASITRNITSSINKCASLQPVTRWRLCILSAGRHFALICLCGSRGGVLGGAGVAAESPGQLLSACLASVVLLSDADFIKVDLHNVCPLGDGWRAPCWLACDVFKVTRARSQDSAAATLADS